MPKQVKPLTEIAVKNLKPKQKAQISAFSGICDSVSEKKATPNIFFAASNDNVLVIIVWGMD